MNQIYIFSGLGADERAFKSLNFKKNDVIYIRWLIPYRNESIELYAERLAKQIIAPHPILIGLSFGGMMAAEVTKIIQPKKLILIASAKGREEIPFYYRLAGIVRAHKLLPAAFLKKSTMLTNWFFGVSDKDDKKLLQEILKDTDTRFLKWAIDQIVRWRNKTAPANCTHIHGTSDRILPYRFVKADICIQGGGHFMTVNKCDEMNKILKTLLNEC